MRCLPIPIIPSEYKLNLRHQGRHGIGVMFSALMCAAVAGCRTESESVEDPTYGSALVGKMATTQSSASFQELSIELELSRGVLQ